MAITRPQLPPRAGYVEVEDENGNRVYKKGGGDPEAVTDAERAAAITEGVNAV